MFIRNVQSEAALAPSDVPAAENAVQVYGVPGFENALVIRPELHFLSIFAMGNCLLQYAARPKTLVSARCWHYGICGDSLRVYGVSVFDKTPLPVERETGT